MPISLGDCGGETDFKLIMSLHLPNSKGRQRMRWLDGITDSMSLSKLWGGCKESDMTEQLNSAELKFS